MNLAYQAEKDSLLLSRRQRQNRSNVGAHCHSRRALASRSHAFSIRAREKAWYTTYKPVVLCYRNSCNTNQIAGFLHVTFFRLLYALREKAWLPTHERLNTGMCPALNFDPVYIVHGQSSIQRLAYSVLCLYECVYLSYTGNA